MVHHNSFNTVARRITSMIGVLLLLLLAHQSASAAVEITGKTSATFKWSRASGSVDSYAVYLSKNGSAFGSEPYEIVSGTQVQVTGKYGDRLRIRVAALDQYLNRGPLSDPSNEIAFVEFVEPAPEPTTPPTETTDPPPTDGGDINTDGGSNTGDNSSGGDGGVTTTPPPSYSPLAIQVESTTNQAAVGQSVQLSATVSGGNDDKGFEYLFDCEGDGNWDGVIRTQDRNRQHQCNFSKVGTYNSRILVWDLSECCGKDEKNISIQVADTLKLAVQSSSNESVAINTPVTLTALVSGGDAASGFEYLFDCEGDGAWDHVKRTSERQVQVQCSFDKAGSYQAKMLAWDLSECCGKDEKTLAIDITSGAMELSVSSSASGPIPASTAVTITAAVSGGSQNSSFEYLFDCEGDGNWDRVMRTNYREVTHKCNYEKAGQYTAKMFAWNLNECCGNDEKTLSIEVLESLQLSIDAISANPTTTGQTVAINASVTGGDGGDWIQYQFDCENDGTWDRTLKSNSKNTSHECVYAEAGEYTAKLRATDASGSDVTLSDKITIYAPLTLSASQLPSEAPYPNEAITLQANISGGQAGKTLDYRFDCDNDGTWDTTIQSDSGSVTHQCSYTAAGQYTAKIWAGSDASCCGSSEKQISPITIVDPIELTAELVDGTTALLNWDPAAGPLAYYAVYVMRNGEALPAEPYDVVDQNEANVYGEPGDEVIVQVAALDENFAPGPLSPPSARIIFVAKEEPSAPDTTSSQEPSETPAPTPLSLTLNSTSSTSLEIGQQLSLTAQVTGGNTGANLRYQFDCEGDGVWEAQRDSSTRSLNHQCSYPAIGSYAPKVLVSDLSGCCGTPVASLGSITVSASYASTSPPEPEPQPAPTPEPEPEPVVEEEPFEQHYNLSDDVHYFFANLDKQSGKDAILLDQDGSFYLAHSEGATFGSLEASVNISEASANEVRFADLNGDGFDDLIVVDTYGPDGESRLSTSRVLISRMTRDGFEAVSVWQNHGEADPEQFFFADMNGDGKDDLAYLDALRSRELLVSLSTGNGFGATRAWKRLPDVPASSLHLTDINGDNMADAIHVDASRNNMMVVSFSTGQAFSQQEEWFQQNISDPSYLQMADLDGDSVSDAIIFEANRSQSIITSMSLYGGDIGQTRLYDLSSSNAGLVQYHDMNGDGKSDLLFFDAERTGEILISLSKGLKLLDPTSWFKPDTGTSEQFFYEDVNGDGLTDIITQRSDNKLAVALSTGMGFLSEILWSNEQ